MENNIEIRKSNIEGDGVFALKDFIKGEKMYDFKKGKVITASEIPSLSNNKKRYLDKIEKDRFEIIEPPACYVNHSCNPNIKETDRTAVALRDIKKGKEITIDYDSIAYLEKPFKCNCGSTECRGSVHGK